MEADNETDIESGSATAFAPFGLAVWCGTVSSWAVASSISTGISSWFSKPQDDPGSDAAGSHMATEKDAFDSHSQPENFFVWNVGRWANDASHGGGYGPSRGFAVWSSAASRICVRAAWFQNIEASVWGPFGFETEGAISFDGWTDTGRRIVFAWGQGCSEHDRCIASWSSTRQKGAAEKAQEGTKGKGWGKNKKERCLRGKRDEMRCWAAAFTRQAFQGLHEAPSWQGKNEETCCSRFQEATFRDSRREGREAPFVVQTGSKTASERICQRLLKMPWQTILHLELLVWEGLHHLMV